MKALSKAIQKALYPTICKNLDELLRKYGKQDAQVRLWDGTTFGKTNRPTFTLVLQHPEALQQLLGPTNQLKLGEAYVAGDFDVEGDIEAAFDFGNYLLSREEAPRPHDGLKFALLNKLAIHEQSTSNEYTLDLHGPIHSKERDLQAIQYHYDLPPEFYALWLDPHMLYSCAYFSDGADLGKAQEQKLHYICKKLRLQRGDFLLDIGCGWGGLLVYAAKHFGVDALGITLSIRQAETARARIHEANLEKHCRVEVCDYRDLEPSLHFDKIVSVGMFEHVGEALLPEYFGRAWRLLRPGGVFLNSGISSVPSRAHHGPSFVDHYVFPDGELVPVGKTISIAEACGFEVRDVENLREHYAMTLHEWVHRLEANAEEAKRLTNEATYRIWRLYMAGSRMSFAREISISIKCCWQNRIMATPGCH